MEEDEKLGQEKGVSFQKPRPFRNTAQKLKLFRPQHMKTNLIHLFRNTTHSCHDVGLNFMGQTSLYYTRVANHDIPENFPDFMHIWRMSDLYPRSIAQCSNSNSRLKTALRKNSGRCEKKSKQRYHKKVSFFYESSGFFKQWLGFQYNFMLAIIERKGINLSWRRLWVGQGGGGKWELRFSLILFQQEIQRMYKLFLARKKNCRWTKGY